MLTPTVKHILKVIFVVIVIAGLLASYLFTGAPQATQTVTEEPVREGFKFIGPSAEPSAAGPSGAPTVNGPATPPPASSN